MSTAPSETSLVPSVQSHISDDLEEMSEKYLSQDVEVTLSTHSAATMVHA